MIIVRKMIHLLNFKKITPTTESDKTSNRVSQGAAIKTDSMGNALIRTIGTHQAFTFDKVKRPNRSVCAG